MKQFVNEHALALQTVMVDGCCGPVELQVYETQSGAYFAVEGSWLEQVPEDDKPLYIPDPFNEGYSVQLIDDMSEKKTELVSGEVNQKLIDKVIEDLQESFEMGDYTTLEDLLSFIPDHILKGHLGE